MTVAPSVLDCPTCGAPTAFGAPFCPYCSAPLTWGDPPRLARGALLVDKRHPAAPLAGRAALKNTPVVETPDGFIVTPNHLGSALAIEDRPRMHDFACVLDAVAIDRGAIISVLARGYADSGVVGGYAATVCPAFRSVRLVRILEGGMLSEIQILQNWTPCPQARGLGEPNLIELRVADAIIEVYINGERALSAVDAALGFGAVGWRVTSLEGPSRALLRGIAAYEVVTVAR